MRGLLQAFVETGTKVTIPAFVGLTVTFTMPFAPPVRVPTVLVADTNVVPAGTGSATFTPVAGLGPAFVTVIVQVIWFPRTAGFGAPLFVIDRSIVGAGGAGGGGGTALTVTGAVSVAVTSGPTGGWPVAVALFVNEAATPARAQS